MALVKFLTLKYRAAGCYDPGPPTWVNPDYVVAVRDGYKTGAHQHSKLRLHGDDNHQDHTDVWDDPETVVAALRDAGIQKDSAQ